ncbi:hypothetical protein LX36DRAFT_739015 [Colletotrichum falcatum]|nr:hypothetical protein LX36DRAFT_739015 [Colletotrichum falcatum]
MGITLILPGILLAITAANGNPIEPPDGSGDPVKGRNDRNLHGEMVRFKRDTVLDARDLELAELHQVNLTEMYKHAVVKRDDGDHVTIWAHKGYVEAEGPEEKRPLTKRQTARLWMGSRFQTNPLLADLCGDHDRRDWVSEKAPTTGGVHAMHQWGLDNMGFFPWGDGYGGWGWRTVLIAGSNGGDNARYRAQFVDGRRDWSGIGTRDVAADADWTRDRERNYNGKWRASSYGWESCGNTITPARANYEIRRFDEQV